MRWFWHVPMRPAISRGRLFHQGLPTQLQLQRPLQPRVSRVALHLPRRILWRLLPKHCLSQQLLVSQWAVRLEYRSMYVRIHRRSTKSKPNVEPLARRRLQLHASVVECWAEGYHGYNSGDGVDCMGGTLSFTVVVSPTQRDHSDSTRKYFSSHHPFFVPR